MRPRASEWIEQLALGALLCVGLPVLNALTTGRHVGSHIAAADWQSAGVELVSIGFGVLLAAAALKVYRKGRRP